jgi:hypothetical protein
VLSTPTIQSGNTKIELKFEIRLDAKELEKALVTRNDSIVVEVMRGMAQGTNKQVNVSPGYNVSVGKSSP